MGHFGPYLGPPILGPSNLMVSWLGDLAQMVAKMAQKGVPEWAILGHSGTPYFEALSAQYEEKGGFWAILGQNGPKRGPKYGPKWASQGSDRPNRAIYREIGLFIGKIGHFGLYLAYLGPNRAIYRQNRPFWPIFGLFGPIWGQYGQIRPNMAYLGLFGPIWAYLGPIWPNKAK